LVKGLKINLRKRSEIFFAKFLFTENQRNTTKLESSKSEDSSSTKS